MKSIALVFLTVLLAWPAAVSAAPAEFTLHEYFVYRDFVAGLEGGASLTLGEWDYHDAQGNWIEVPRVINGRIAGPGTVTSGGFNGFKADPGWTRIEVQGGYQTLELRGAEDDGSLRGVPGAWGGWTTVADSNVPAALADMQYLSYRITLGGGDEVSQVDLTVTVDVRDAPPPVACR